MQGVDLKKRLRAAFAKLPSDLRRLPVLLAVSSGRDSTVLAAVALELRRELPPLHFIHVNYHLRVPDSDAEEAFLRAWAKREGVPIFVKRIFPRNSPANLQAWARERRLRFFSEVTGKFPGKKALVWTAHHRRDQAETILERMLRGAGLRGMGAMAELEKFEDAGEKVLGAPLLLFRPFLEVPDEAFKVYVRHHRLAFHVDRSNATPCYRRNRIRREILPLLEKENPRVEEALSSLARNLRRAQTAIDAMAEAWLERFRSRGQQLPFGELQALSPGVGAVVLEKWLESQEKQRLPLSQVLPRIQRYLENPQGELHIPLKKGRVLHLNSFRIKLNKKTK